MNNFKTLLIVGSIGLTFVAAEASADYRTSTIGTSYGSNYVINAGSGLVIQTPGADRYNNRNGHNNRYNNRHNGHRNERSYRNNRYGNTGNHWSDGRRSNTSALLTTGNLSVYWSDGDYRNSRTHYDTSWNTRNDDVYYMDERREGDFLKDRYGNCFRMDGNGRNERRVRVRSSYCRV